MQAKVHNELGRPRIVTEGATARRRQVGVACALALLGVVIVWGQGFSNIEAMHNAAHDTRHSKVFPCH